MPATSEGTRDRGPVLLAAALLVGTFLLDSLSSASMWGDESFVVMTEGSMTLLHTGWWGRLHLAMATAIGLAGLLLMADRRWAAVLAVVVATAGMVTDVLTLPYDPLPTSLAIGFEAAAVVLLVRHGRLRTPAGRSAPVTQVGRSDP